MSDIKQVISSPYDHIRDRISDPDEHIRDRIGSPYRHINVGQTDYIGDTKECASILDSNDGHPVFEVSVGDGCVEMAEACDHYYRAITTKSDAIAALKELINYIEAKSDE